MERECPLLQLEWYSRLLPSLIISLHEFGAMFTCLLIIIVHADHHTWEIIIIVFCKQSSNLLAEPSLSIIPCYAFSSMWEKAASYDRIVRTLCFGGFCNTSWIKLWPNFKETKRIAKIVVATIHGAWVFFTFTCLPLQKRHTFTGFPEVTRSVM